MVKRLRVAQKGRPTVRATETRAWIGSASLLALGGAAMAGYQWLFLVAIARWLNLVSLGVYAYGLAVSAPLLLLSGVGLRLVQLRDTDQAYRLALYTRLRWMTALPVIPIAFAVGMSQGSPLRSRLIYALIVLIRVIENVADARYVYGISSGSTPRVGMAMALRALTCAVGGITSLLLGATLPVALCVVALIAGTVCLTSDRLLIPAPPGPANRTHPPKLRAGGVVLSAIPLGIASALVSLHYNVPRYFLSGSHGDRAVGIFSAIGYIFPAASLATAALGQTAIPGLTRFASSNDWRSFVGRLRLLLLGAVASGLLLLGGAALVGRPILTALYGAEVGRESRALVWMCVALLFGFAVTFMQDALTALGAGISQVAAFAIGLAGVTAWCAYRIPAGGLVAAAQSIAVGSAIELGVFALITSRLIRRRRTDASPC